MARNQSIHRRITKGQPAKPTRGVGLFFVSQDSQSKQRGLIESKCADINADSVQQDADEQSNKNRNQQAHYGGQRITGGESSYAALVYQDIAKKRKRQIEKTQYREEEIKRKVRQ